MIDRRAVMKAVAAAGSAVLLPDATWSAPPAADDIAILAETYRALHPGLYRYQSPAAFDGEFARLAKDWSADAALPARFLALSRFLATIRCGHSYANFFNQKQAVATKLWGGATRLPFHFSWIDEEMVVTRDPARTGILPGSVIETIDGVAASAMLRALIPYARADGHNLAKRVHLLGVSGKDGIEYFDVFQGLLFPPRGSRFALRVRAPDGRRRSAAVVPIDLPARRAQMVANAEGDGPAWTIDHRPGAIAVMTMPGWALYDSKWGWRGWLDTQFADMARRGTRTLIVDVRDNEGGLDCGNEIIARLIDRPASPDLLERRVRYRRVPDGLRANLDTWDNSFFDWGSDATPIDNRYYRLKRDAGDEVIAPKGPRFRGRVIVLTDAGNSSATFQFAQLMKRNRLATLVGSATGGNQHGINGGAFFFLRLPECGLEVDLPLIGTFAATPRPDAGIAPDVAIAPTAGDIAHGRDAVLEKALSLAQA